MNSVWDLAVSSSAVSNAVTAASSRAVHVDLTSQQVFKCAHWSTNAHYYYYYYINIIQYVLHDSGLLHHVVTRLISTTRAL